MRATCLFFLALLMTAGWYGCEVAAKPDPGTPAIEEIGRRLFFDRRLSFNNTKSCSSCHDPAFAFTDGYRKSITSTGDISLRNSPTLLNTANYHYFDWADPGKQTLEAQLQRPFFNQHPVELGWTGQEDKILTQLSGDSVYMNWFAMNGSADKQTITKAIHLALSAYVRSLRSLQSAYDLFMKGERQRMDSSAQLGLRLFLSDRLKCGSCHIPPDFTSVTRTKNPDSVYFNTGLYETYADAGLQLFSGQQQNHGKFKTPSLRNIALTAPYMHDGSVATLAEVIDIYAAGGRVIVAGDGKGDGRKAKQKDARITGFELSTEEKRALLDFLHALTDSTIFNRADFKDPFPPTQN